MNGWNCRPASRSQNRPRMTWSVRCVLTSEKDRRGASIGGSSSDCTVVMVHPPILGYFGSLRRLLGSATKQVDSASAHGQLTQARGTIIVPPAGIGTRSGALSPAPALTDHQ